MPRQTTSQWDFSGELFPVEATRRVFSVTELTSDIRRLLEQHIGTVWVTGEITNCRAQSSGHVYFTLKDAGAQLNCIVFRTDALANREELQDGRRVILKGEMTVYEPRGQYQLRVLTVELQGVGALQAAFERLKQKLAAEGLFDLTRKRPLPRFPQRIGLVTSPTGAAMHDVLHVVKRRNPSLSIILAPSAVQGPGASADIAAAIERLNQWSKVPGQALDLILLTRGGGSLEDLWAFNEEIVARAVFNSALPVVSAVGHEIDFTISDFVADLRAATPSAAAEILTEGVFASCKWMTQARAQMREHVRRRLAGERRHFQQLGQRLQAVHPRRLLNQRLQLLDDLQTALGRCARQQLEKRGVTARNLALHLSRVRPDKLLTQRRATLTQARRRLREAVRQQYRQLRQRREALQARLQLLGPEQVLARGYSITQDAATGKIIRSKTQTRPGQTLKTHLQSGEVQSVVEKAMKNAE
jgi:exodeoxyribonuclease VII large subunit